MSPSTRTVNLIVIHCAATPSGKPIARAGLSAAGVIDAWHAARGFRRSARALRQHSPSLPHIGYHYVVDLDGTVFRGRGEDEVGAHALHFNAHAIGICMVGGLEREARYTKAQWDSLAELVSVVLVERGIPRALPRRIVGKRYSIGYTLVDGVCGHRDLSPDSNGNGMTEPFEWLKTCPGFDVGAWLARGMRPADKHIYTE